MYYLEQTSLVDGGPALESCGLVHRVRQPMMAGPHPTIVMLHGLGGSESSTWLLGSALPRDWLVVAPRGIARVPAGGRAWYERRGDEWPALEDFEPAVTAVAGFVAALPGMYAADPDRLFFMGFSQGAATAFAVAVAQRSLVSGVVSIVGFAPKGCSTADLASLQDLPVFMAAGIRDTLVPLERSRLCARVLGEAGARLEYHEYEVGHKLSMQAARDLREWWVRRL
jgi:predicted esterase